jgi:hypothetical protein
MGAMAQARPLHDPVRIARSARQVQLFQLIALKDFLQKISALLSADYGEFQDIEAASQATREEVE